MTYNVFGGTLNLTQSVNQSCILLKLCCWLLCCMHLLNVKVVRIVQRF